MFILIGSDLILYKIFILGKCMLIYLGVFWVFGKGLRSCGYIIIMCYLVLIVLVLILDFLVRWNKGGKIGINVYLFKYWWM